VIRNDRLTVVSMRDRGFARGADTVLMDAPLRREEGQTMAEYAVVLSLLTITTAAVFLALSGGVANAMTTVTGIV
jgi:Flp pilus assembly pilin Flp